MNLKKLFSFLFIFFISVTISAQSSFILDWKTKNYLDSEISSFNESVFLSKYNGLPCYQKINRINQNYYYDIEIYDTHFMNVTEKELSLIHI